MLKIITRPIGKLFNSLGYDVTKRVSSYTGGSAEHWLLKLGIETILDVGANEGQFSQSISKVLPGKKIIAFEPIKRCYDMLVANTGGLDIKVFNCGLSDKNGTSEINISENFFSSSLLPLENDNKVLYPKVRYVDKETIELKRLDDVISGLRLTDNILLKIDVQGYEDKVVAGGAETVRRSAAIVVESSYRPLYVGQWLFDETYRYFVGAGFIFAGVIDQARSKKTGLPIYGDAIFIRKDLYSKVL